MLFKVGDVITTNSLFDEKRKRNVWWNESKEKNMTIRRIEPNEEWCIVNENPFYWPLNEMLKVEDFFKEEEFEI